MAYISKPVRHICYPAVAGAIAFLIYKMATHFIGAWAYLIALPAFFWFYQLGSPVDKLDLWLRKYTKDDLWLFTQEGEEWLKSGQGREWAATYQKKAD